MSIEALIKDNIKDVPDFPKPGILFKDITPLLSAPEVLSAIIDHLAAHFADSGITHLAGVESRGFIFGTALAYKMGVGLVLVRKPGKLPRETHSVSYELEYGTDTLEVHKDDLGEGDKVLIIDDLLATGGTAEAAGRLIQATGADVAGLCVIIELAFLNGRDRLGTLPVHSLATY